MTRSKQRKIRHEQQPDAAHARSRRYSFAAKALPLASAIIACLNTAQAQDATASASPAPSGTLEDIVVTAQKRTENLQNVPLSITALGTQQLEQLNVQNFDDYVQYLPSVSIRSTGPGQEKIYMRGVSSGGDGVHDGTVPSVGVYLDEQPVTTIQGVLPIHVYDIQRVEALAGPQGTLYGASSEAGTLRIITNKPEFDQLTGAYDVQANDVTHGDPGYTTEGFINIPLGSSAAIRLVGWYEKDGGYINNVPGSMTYPGSATAPSFTLSNTPTPGNPAPNTTYTGTAKNAYNDVETAGGRAALKVALGDNWTVTPTLQGQTLSSDGIPAMEMTKAVPGYPGLYPDLGPLEVQHYNPETQTDDWTQATLTVEGHVSNFDVTYAGGFVHRNSIEHSDYADYSLAYEINYYGPKYFKDNAGNPILPAQQITDTDGYKMESHELRVSTPVDVPVHATFGAFTELQTDAYIQNYQIADLSTAQSVSGWQNTWYLTDQREARRDYAGFGEVTWDVTSHLSLLGGLRYYEYDNSSQGFSGFWFSEAKCATPTVIDPYSGGPCQNRFSVATGSGVTPKYTVTYKFDDQRLIYATASKGFRPGGTNTNGPQYQSDTLQNYEVGWKTSWLGNTLRVNGAIFQEDWNNFQFTFPGQYGILETQNAGGARIRGIESSIDWAASSALTFGGGFSYLDAVLTVPYCSYLSPSGAVQSSTCYNYASGTPVAEAYGAPVGQQLPNTPKFKGNLTTRYTLEPIGEWLPHIQGSLVYQTAVWADLRTVQRDELGQQPAYALVDASFGAEKNGLSLEFFINNAFNRLAENYRYAECTATVCGAEAVYANVYKPRLFGVKFAQKF
ncbi:MAG: TonB-dependent receptor [Steroidobacteraceae bacterium]|jgi:iron complex outermembrane receptor protein